MEDFEVKWPDDDNDMIDDNPVSQPDQRSLRLQYYDQLSFEGCDEDTAGQLIVSDTPTFGVVDSLMSAARNRCGRIIS